VSDSIQSNERASAKPRGTADNGRWTRGSGRGKRPPRGRVADIPTPPPAFRYSIADLEEQVGIPSRTIRYYISQGLLPPAHGRGPSATYDLGHLMRLRMIGSLRSTHLPLDQIKERLANLSDSEIAALLEVETEPPEDRWRRIELHPDIELHVRERGGNRDLQLHAAVELIVNLALPVIDRLEQER